jgi:hypothetical protein
MRWWTLWRALVRRFTFPIAIFEAAIGVCCSNASISTRRIFHLPLAFDRWNRPVV